jgi:exportin-T
MSTLEHFAKDERDLSTAKLSFIVLTKMVNIWGGPDIAIQNSVNGNASPAPSLPGFSRFMIERFSPLSWALPSSSSFNAKDAQSRQVLGEAGVMKKAILNKTGQEYLQWLRDVELRSTGMDETAIEQFLKSINDLDSKQFRMYFQVRTSPIPIYFPIPSLPVIMSNKANVYLLEYHLEDGRKMTAIRNIDKYPHS